MNYNLIKVREEEVGMKRLKVSIHKNLYGEKMSRLSSYYCGKSDAEVVIRELCEIFDRPSIDIGICKKKRALGGAVIGQDKILLKSSNSLGTVVHEFVHTLGIYNHNDEFYSKCEEVAEVAIGII